MVKLPREVSLPGLVTIVNSNDYDDHDDNHEDADCHANDDANDDDDDTSS